MIGIVGAALHRRVVGDDQHFAARHAADAGDDAGAGRLVVVHADGGERRQLEERRAGIEQPLDALAHRQLALLAVALRGTSAPPPSRARLSALAQLGDELLHPLAVGLERRRSDGSTRVSSVHYHPQQSVLKPHAGQRQTACIRYISAPQRSHSILLGGRPARSSADLRGVIGRAADRRGVGMRRIPACARIIADAACLNGRRA